MTDVGRRRYRGAAARHSAAAAAANASRFIKKDADSAGEDDEDDDLDDGSDTDRSPQIPSSALYPSRGKHQTISALSSADLRAASSSSGSAVPTLFRNTFPSSHHPHLPGSSVSSTSPLGLNTNSSPSNSMPHDSGSLNGLQALGALASSIPQMPPFSALPFVPNGDSSFNFNSMPANSQGATQAAADGSQFGLSQVQLQHLQKLQQQQMMQLQQQYQQQQLQSLLQSGMSLQDVQQLQLRQLLQQQQQQQQQWYASMAYLLPTMNFMYPNGNTPAMPPAHPNTSAPTSTTSSTSTTGTPAPLPSASSQLSDQSQVSLDSSLDTKTGFANGHKPTDTASQPSGATSPNQSSSPPPSLCNALPAPPSSLSPSVPPASTSDSAMAVDSKGPPTSSEFAEAHHIPSPADSKPPLSVLATSISVSANGIEAGLASIKS